jgi:redox-regulated HSP33 family molecular chaperone
MSTDSVLRAVSNDGGFRVITALTTETARAAIAAQRAEGETALLFAGLLTGAVLFRETMAPNMRIQCVLDAGGRRLVADAHPGGDTRGLVTLEAGEVRCRCSRDRAGIALAQLGRDEVEQALRDGRSIDATCDYCRADYRFERDDLALLLATAPGRH